MSQLHFVTGNKGKFQEVQAILGEIGVTVHQVNIDLTEIQGSSEQIVRAKLQEAQKIVSPETLPIMVEDTGLQFDSMGGLPGPYIKQMMLSVADEQIVALAHTNNDGRAVAVCCLGYLAASDAEPQFFTGQLAGKMVLPRGAHGHCWDRIFEPTLEANEANEKTFAEMTMMEKNQISQRTLALRKLQKYLQSA